MKKESGSKKKRRLLKIAGLCIITAASFGILVLAYNANSSSHTQYYKESDENLNIVIAKQLGYDPNRLTAEAFLKVVNTNVYPNELTYLNPLAKLQNLTKIWFFIAPNQEIDFRPLATLEKLKTVVIQTDNIFTAITLRTPTFLPKTKKPNWYDRVFSFFSRFNPSQSKTNSLDLSQFRNIRSLESLTIRGFELRNIKALASLKSLDSLVLGPSLSPYLLSTTAANTTQRKPKPPDLSQLKYLPQLLHLDISSIKVRDYDFLGKLKNLNYLELQGTSISDLKNVSGLSNLEYLSLQRTNIKDINLLANLTGLKSLDLSYTKIENIDILASLVNLHTLKLSETQVRDIRVLSKLTNLEYLTLDSTKINNIEPLAKLINLESLYLSSTDINDISPLLGLEHLQKLYMSKTPIRDISVLGNLKSLQQLSLENMNIDDIRPLEKLPNLKSLDLRNTPVSEDQINELKKSMPDLTIYR